MKKSATGCSSVRLECASGGREAVGSNPIIPTQQRPNWFLMNWLGLIFFNNRLFLLAVLSRKRPFPTKKTSPAVGKGEEDIPGLRPIRPPVDSITPIGIAPAACICLLTLKPLAWGPIIFRRSLTGLVKFSLENHFRLSARRWCEAIYPVLFPPPPGSAADFFQRLIRPVPGTGSSILKSDWDVPGAFRPVRWVCSAHSMLPRLPWSWIWMWIFFFCSRQLSYGFVL